MESAKGKESKGLARQHNRFFKEGNCWYFASEKGGRFGPFDRVYEIVMGECHIGEWKCEPREVSGGDIAQALWPYTAA